MSSKRFFEIAGNMYRNSFSKELLEVLEKLKSEGKIPKEVIEAETVISVGGAFCNDIMMLINRGFFHPFVKHIYAIDPDFPPYVGFKSYIKYIPKYVQDIKPQDIPRTGKRVIESSHVAQSYMLDTDKIGYLEGLRSLMEEGEYLIFVEEIVRPGWGRFIDRSFHYFYNNRGLGDLWNHLKDQSLDDGYYIKKSILDYERLAKKAGFEFVVSRLYFRGSFVAIFKAVPVKK